MDLTKNKSENDDIDQPKYPIQNVNPLYFLTYDDDTPHPYFPPIETVAKNNYTLRYLSTYYPPSFKNMLRYAMYKYPLGGTRKRKRRSKKNKLF
jgi:hypothetical protein